MIHSKQPPFFVGFYPNQSYKKFGVVCIFMPLGAWKVVKWCFVYKGKIKEKKEYHGIDNDDQDITWESLKIINELKPSIFSELAGFKNKNHIIHLVNTD